MAFNIGITSACAEKSLLTRFRSSIRGNYLRMRGEEDVAVHPGCR